MASTVRIDVRKAQRKVGTQKGAGRAQWPLGPEDQGAGFDRANAGGRHAARPGPTGQLDRDIDLDANRAIDLDGITYA